MMTDRHIYIRAMAMVSAGAPFGDDLTWLREADLPNGEGVSPATSMLLPTVEADYSKFITPMEGRRMGKLMKRALATSLTVLREAGVEHPDAIITGTSLGSVADMESVLGSVCENGGESVKPTAFMQSTHNTVGSMIALKTGTHGYNCTWSQEALSFENALCDALTQLRLGRIDNALVGAFDEFSPDVLEVQRRGGLLKDGCLAGEVAASFLLETGGSVRAMSEKPGSVGGYVAEVSENVSGRAAEMEPVEVAAVRTAYIPDTARQPMELAGILEDMLGKAGLSMGDIDFVLTGRHGTGSDVYAAESSRKSRSFPEDSLRESQPFHAESQPCSGDAVYDRLNALWQGSPQGRWKYIFGEGFSSSAAGFHTAATCLRQGLIPAPLLLPRSVSPAAGSLSNVSPVGSIHPDGISPVELPSGTSQKTPHNIIVFNHFAARHFSLILLRKN